MSTLATEEVVVPTYSHRPRFATDTTSTSHSEAFSPPASGTADFPERAASLASFTLHLPAAASRKSFWFSLMQSRNELVQVIDFEASQEQLDYPADLPATEIFSAEVSGILGHWLQAFSAAEDNSEISRGTRAVSYPRKVIFSQELELHVRALPRWRPFIAIDRRTREASDE